jgi:hypothetical protein
MADLFTCLASSSCLIVWYCTSVIRRRLGEANEPPVSQLIFNGPRLLRRYLELAADHSWSRVPAVVAYVAMGSGVTSCVGFAVLLLAHKLK